MSNKLITDTFPKVKKQRIIKKDAKTSKDKRQKIPDLSVSQTQGIRKDLQLLKEFDMNSDFGPCIGISRMERWERAEKFGLHPPQNIKDIISQNSNDENYLECIWSKEKL